MATVDNKPSALRALPPTLSRFTTTMVVIGSMIGSGIFRKPGSMAEAVGSVGVLLAAWAVAGLMTLFGALTNAEIAAAIPKTGGQYTYFDRIYGRFFAYLYGWSAFSVIQTGSIASVAYVFAEYFGRFVHLDELSPDVAGLAMHLPFIGDILPFKAIGVKAVACLLVVVLTGVNYFGARFGGAVQNVFTVSKILAMLVLVILAFTVTGVGSFDHLSGFMTTDKLAKMGMLGAFVFAMQKAFWGYDGWNSVTYVAGEVKDPQRNLPKAIITGVCVVIFIYLLMNVVYCYVLPFDKVVGAKLVAADAAEALFSGGGRWIAAAVMISTFGTVNGTTMASARVYFSMARNKVFPQFMGYTHARFNTPAVSLLWQGAWSCALIFSGTFETLTDTLIFVTWIFYGAAALGVFVLRRREPDLDRPYRVPGYPLLPAVFVLFSAAFLGITIYNDITKYLTNGYEAGEPHIINFAFGLFLVLLGTPVYFYYRWKNTPG